MLNRCFAPVFYQPRLYPYFCKVQNNYSDENHLQKFKIPASWSELSDKQLRYVYQLIADNFATDEIKTLCLLRWSGTKVKDL